MKKTIRTAQLAALAAATTFILPAAAQVYDNSATATFNVNLTIDADCTIAANPLSFGASGVLDTNIDAETTLDVTCTSTTPYNNGLDAGNVAGSTVANRLMAGTAGGTATTVAYQLYQDPARATV